MDLQTNTLLVCLKRLNTNIPFSFKYNLDAPLDLNRQKVCATIVMYGLMDLQTNKLLVCLKRLNTNIPFSFKYNLDTPFDLTLCLPSTKFPVCHIILGHTGIGATLISTVFNSLYLFTYKSYGEFQKARLINACRQCEPKTMVIASFSNTIEQ